MPSVREAVAVFHDASDLQQAIDDLLAHGFDRAELSLLAGEDAIAEKLGHTYRKTSELEDDPNVPRIEYISPETFGDTQGALIGTPLYIAATTATIAVMVSGGTLAAAIAGAVAAGGAGAALGAIFAKLVGDHHARHIERQLEHGGLLLWVRTWNQNDESGAVEILQKHAGDDVHVHGVERRPGESRES
ncbi:MAG: hypothetical protein NXH71_10980 [Erythrobacteraceae bacterium]|jgi:hypothetical protein|nr:hypothetical protein [Erythrobacteraceae bacterium]